MLSPTLFSHGLVSLLGVSPGILLGLQIDDDAASRKEPGWKAKAAGIKGGREIVGCSDVGASGSGG